MQCDWSGLQCLAMLQLGSCHKLFTVIQNYSMNSCIYDGSIQSCLTSPLSHCGTAGGEGIGDKCGDVNRFPEPLVLKPSVGFSGPVLKNKLDAADVVVVTDMIVSLLDELRMLWKDGVERENGEDSGIGEFIPCTCTSDGLSVFPVVSDATDVTALL